MIAVAVALEERGEARRHAQNDLLYTTRLAASDAEAAVGATAALLAAVAGDLAAQPGVAHCERLLGLVPKATKSYRSVGVARADGRVYCGTTARGVAGPTKPVDVSGAPWFRRAQRAQGFVLGEYGAEPVSREEALIGSRRMGAGRRPAVIFAALNLHRFSERLGFHDAPERTIFTLLDHRGTVVARLPPAGLVGRRLREEPLVETVLSRREGTAEVRGLDGVHRIYGFAPVQGNARGRLFVTAGRSSSARAT
jgi:hypothetical protein